MMVAVCLTIFHIYKAIAHYKNQSTMTTVKTVRNGDLLLPDLMLCYEHWVYWVDWKKVTKLGFTKETALYGLSFLSTIYTETHFNTTRTRIEFASKMASYNMTHVSEFYRAIAYTSPPRVSIPEFLKDTWFKTIEFSFYEPISLCYVTPGQRVVDDTRQRFFGSQIQLFVENEPFSNFNQYLSKVEYSSYLHFMLIKEGLLKFKHDTGRNNFTDYQVPIWIHANKKHTDGVMISSDISAYTIAVTASVREWQSRADKPCLDTKRMANSDIECYFRCYSLGYFNTCNQCLQAQLAIALNVDVIDLLCQNDLNLLMNTNDDTINFSNLTMKRSSPKNYTSPILGGAGDPIANASYADRAASSQLEDNLSANVTCVDHEAQQKCKDERCIPACQLWDFDKSVSVAMYPKFLHQIADQARTTILIYYPSEENIFVMSEIDSLTWDGLVANIGGLLGIWLGASMVSFLQMFYRCCMCVADDGDCNETASICGLNIEKSKEKGKCIIIRHATKEERDNFV